VVTGKAREPGGDGVATAPPLHGAHLQPELMARLLTGRMESGELAEVVLAHLLALCPECRTVRRQLEDCLHEVGHWDYVVALGEGAEAPGLWRLLEALPYAEQRQAIDTESAFQTWGLCRLLHHRSERAARDQPATAAQLASLAVEISARLGDVYHPAWVQDLRALSHAYLGHARRCLGELHAAGDDFAAARSLRRAGTGYPGVEAEAMALEALFQRDERRLPEALALLDRAWAIYRGAASAPADPDAAEPRLAARVRAHQAWCRYHSGQPEAALAQLQEAEPLVDRERDPWLCVAVHHGQVCAAVVLGQIEQAQGLLPLAVELADRHGNDLDRLRLRRVAARIDRAQNQKDRAGEALREASRALLGRAAGLEAALTFLDLADLYLEQGAQEEVKALGNEVLPVFSPGFPGDDLPLSGLSAMLLFQQACWNDRLTPDLLRALGHVLETHRRPSLAWWSTWGTDWFGERMPEVAVEPSLPESGP
jgi:hypothetical protein